MGGIGDAGAALFVDVGRAALPVLPRSCWMSGRMAGVWVTGHWTTGKLGISSLAAIVRELCLKAGLSDALIDVSALTNQVAGYVVTSRSDARRLIEELMSGYFFDAVESAGILRFVPRGRGLRCFH